jgi:hypothetical protein
LTKRASSLGCGSATFAVVVGVVAVGSTPEPAVGRVPRVNSHAAVPRPPTMSRPRTTTSATIGVLRLRRGGGGVPHTGGVVPPYGGA